MTRRNETTAPAEAWHDLAGNALALAACTTTDRQRSAARAACGRAAHDSGDLAGLLAALGLDHEENDQ